MAISPDLVFRTSVSCFGGYVETFDSDLWLNPAAAIALIRLVEDNYQEELAIDVFRAVRRAGQRQGLRAHYRFQITVENDKMRKLGIFCVQQA
ncbi:MAG: hypothetical protein JNK19_06015 [Tabrizicola sp.]|nr:hypothetical protein [Tabrizicola sp.]